MAPRKMVKLNIEETSGVDHPAHLDEGWILMKNSGLENEDFTVIEKMVALEAELEKAQARIAELESDPEDDEDDDDATDEDTLLKSAPPAVREALEKARNAAFVAEEELRKEREIRLDAEAVAKSAERFPNLPIEHDEFAPALRRLSEFAPELADTVTKALDAANGQAESAAIFAEIGSSFVPQTGDAYQRIEMLAKSAVSRGEYATVEQAVSGLIATNPSLYADYIAETR